MFAGSMRAKWQGRLGGPEGGANSTTLLVVVARSKPDGKVRCVQLYMQSTPLLYMYGYTCRPRLCYMCTAIHAVHACAICVQLYMQPTPLLYVNSYTCRPRL